MARVLTLESLFNLSCPIEMVSPGATEIPFVVEGIERFPNSDFMIEVGTERAILASCSIDDSSISLQGASLQDALESSSALQMRLVSPCGGYALAETSIRIHPFYNIQLNPVNNGIHIELPDDYTPHSDGDSSLRFYSTTFSYNPNTNTIDSKPEVQFDYDFYSNQTLSFGTPPPEYDIAILIRVVDGIHQREEYFPIRTQRLILGKVSLSHTQLLKREVPKISQVEFIHHPNRPPEANLGAYEFKRTDEGEWQNVRPVVFNRAGWKMVPACKEGTCNQFGILVHFSSVETADDYPYLHSMAFFNDLETKVVLGRFEPIDEQQLLARQDRLECTLLPTLKRNIISLIDALYDLGLNQMLKYKYSPRDKVKINVGDHSIESPPRDKKWNLIGELFEFVCDDRGRFDHIQFFNGGLCTIHEADFFFVVDTKHLEANDEQNVQWVKQGEHALVTFPKYGPEIGKVEVKARLPKFGLNPKPSIVLGVWEQ